MLQSAQSKLSIKNKIRWIYAKWVIFFSHRQSKMNITVITEREQKAPQGKCWYLSTVSAVITMRKKMCKIINVPIFCSLNTLLCLLLYYSHTSFRRILRHQEELNIWGEKEGEGEKRERERDGCITQFWRISTAVINRPIAERGNSKLSLTAVPH